MLGYSGKFSFFFFRSGCNLTAGESRFHVGEW